jgi:F-type H+-transporting ATPase subunit b
VGIDWVTIAAQIVNFLILVWVLQRVLYRPLSRALDDRGVEVGRRLAEAEAARAEATAAAARHRAATDAVEADRQAQLDAARAGAEALHHRMLAEAQADIAARRTAWADQLAAEKTAFLERLRRRAGEAFVTLARQALSDMADRDLVDQIARVFVRKLGALDEPARAALRTAAEAGEGPRILSSLTLSESARATVAKGVAELTGQLGDVAFETDPALDCGVVLVLGSRRVGWTIGEHLDALESEVLGILDAGTGGMAT